MTALATCFCFACGAVAFARNAAHLQDTLPAVTLAVFEDKVPTLNSFCTSGKTEAQL
jgi:hypothetical protein